MKIWVLILLVGTAGCPKFEPIEPPGEDVTFGWNDDDDSSSDDDDSSSDDDDSSTADDPWVEWAPYPVCATPVASPGSYLDGLLGSGVDFVHATDPAFTADPNDLLSAFSDVLTTGVVAADLDGDGPLDLFFTNTVGPSRFYWGNGDGTFVPGESILAEAISGLTNAADYDGDGDLDLLVGGRDHLLLLRNEGDRDFTDVTEAMGVVQPDGWAGGSAWADWDMDGDLDLYAGGYVTSTLTDHETFWEGTSTANVLYRQEGGVFIDERDLLGPLSTEDGAVLHARWRDLDRDGDPDLVQVNDFGDLLINTFLWENEEGAGGVRGFSEKGVGGGVPYMSAPMGLLAHDFDGDGWDDLWFSDFGDHTILKALPGGWSWIDVTLSWMGFVPLISEEASWSVIGTDSDGDGVLEVFVPYGPIPTVFNGADLQFPNQGDRFLVNQGTTESPDFREAQDQVLPSALDGLSRAAIEADLNDDGVPDLVVPHVGSAPSLLLGQCTDNRRLTVTLRDPGSANYFAVGARVTVQSAARSQTRVIEAGGRGTFSGGDPTVFFGLGESQSPVRLQVLWPGGTESLHEDVCAHCRVTVTRPPAQ